MTVVTVRPNATTANTGTVTGAASAHAALSDNSDSSYVTLASGDEFVVGLADVTIPATAVVKAISTRIRCLRISGGGSTFAILSTGVPRSYTGDAQVTWTSPTTITIIQTSAVSGEADATIDAATLEIEASGLVTVRVHEAYVDVTYVAQATTVVTVGGTITDTNFPSVSWVNTLDSDGGAQTRYEVKVFTDAQYGAGGFDPDTSTPFDTSGIVDSAAASWAPATAQPDDTYRAYVRVAQTVNGTLHWSEFAFDEYTITVDRPAVPSISATAENADGRVRIDLAENAGDATTDQFEVQRSEDGGVTWAAIRTVLGGGLVDDADTVIYDWEAPNGVLVTYRARALHDYSGVNAASDWATDTVTWESTSWWIKHPSLPNLNLPVEMHSFPTTTRAARQGVIQPIGAAFPVVVTDTPASVTGTIVLRIDEAADRIALDELLATGDTLLLQGPASHDEPDRYVRIGDHDRTRVVDKAFVTYRFETLPFVEVTAPTDNLQIWDVS